MIKKILWRTFPNFLCPNEYQECKTYYEWACLNPLLREYLIKHVNEGKRSKAGGFFLQMIGMRRGLLDYQLPVYNGKYYGLWLEFKTRNKIKHKIPRDQESWIFRLQKAGHYATIVFGCDHAIQVTTDYLQNKL